jgi:hypothetical protein
MRNLALSALLASTAALAGCATVAPVTAANGVCGNYGYVDANNDGYISGDEWNTYRTGSYGYWDTNHDGRISQSEFENCYRAGGFYRDAYYHPDYWNNYWTTFDANGDGYLSADEYWSANAWSRADRNHNGRIDADEWVWWGS